MIESLVLFVSVVASVLIGFSLGITHSKYKSAKETKYASTVNEAKAHAKSGFGDGWAAKIGKIIVGQNPSEKDISVYNTKDTKGLEGIGHAEGYRPPKSSDADAPSSIRYHNLKGVALSTGGGDIDFEDQSVKIRTSNIHGAPNIKAKDIILDNTTIYHEGRDTEPTKISVDRDALIVDAQLPENAKIESYGGDVRLHDHNPKNKIGSITATRQVRVGFTNSPDVQKTGKSNIGTVHAGGYVLSKDANIDEIKASGNFRQKISGSPMDELYTDAEENPTVTVAGQSNIKSIIAGNQEVVLGKDTNVGNVASNTSEKPPNVNVYDTPLGNSCAGFMPEPEDKIDNPAGLTRHKDNTVSYKAQAKKKE